MKRVWRMADAEELAAFICAAPVLRDTLRTTKAFGTDGSMEQHYGRGGD